MFVVVNVNEADIRIFKAERKTAFICKGFGGAPFSCAEIAPQEIGIHRLPGDVVAPAVTVDVCERHAFTGKIAVRAVRIAHLGPLSPAMRSVRTDAHVEIYLMITGFGNEKVGKAVRIHVVQGRVRFIYQDGIGRKTSLFLSLHRYDTGFCGIECGVGELRGRQFGCAVISRLCDASEKAEISVFKIAQIIAPDEFVIGFHGD